MHFGTSTGISKKNDKLLRWFLIAILLGTLFGSVLYVLYPSHMIWHEPLFRQGIGTAPAAFDFTEMFLAICVVSVFWTVLTAVLGTSLAAIPLTFCLLVMRAAAIGAVLSELYCMQGTTGLLTAVLFVMPYAVFSMFVYVLGIRESIRFSLSLLQLVKQGRGDSLSVRLYLMRFLMILILTLAGGLLQCVWLKYGYTGFLELMAKG